MQGSTRLCIAEEHFAWRFYGGWQGRQMRTQAGSLQTNHGTWCITLSSVLRIPSPTEFDFDDEPALTTPKNTYINRRRLPGTPAVM